MNMRTVSSTAAAGVREAERRFERAATDIAKQTTSSSNERMDVVALSPDASERPDVAGFDSSISEAMPSTLDVLAAESRTDLATSFVSMSQAKAAFSANLAVLRTADETERSVLDIQG